MKHNCGWVLSVIAIAAVVLVVGVTCPAAIKKFGLFSGLIGAAVAYSAWTLRKSWQLSHATWQPWFVVLLAAATEAGRIVETFRQFAAQQQAQLERQLQQADGWAAMFSQQLTDQVKLSWQDFLVIRYDPLPWFDFENEPTSLVFVLLTLEVLAAVTGAAVAWIVLNRNTDQNLSREPSNSESNSHLEKDATA